MSVELVECCPECKSAWVEERVTKRPKWRCRDCGHEFDETDERKSKGSGFNNGSLTDKLHRSNPEDLGLSPMEDQ